MSGGPSPHDQAFRDRHTDTRKQADDNGVLRLRQYREERLSEACFSYNSLLREQGVRFDAKSCDRLRFFRVVSDYQPTATTHVKWQRAKMSTYKAELMAKRANRTKHGIPDQGPFVRPWHLQAPHVSSFVVLSSPCLFADLGCVSSAFWHSPDNGNARQLIQTTAAHHQNEPCVGKQAAVV